MQTLHKPSLKIKISLQFCENPVSCGFPSPAMDFLQKPLDLNEFMIKRPASTYLFRTSGNSMKGANINSSDILVVDRSLHPKNGSVVLAILDGEFLVKRFFKKEDVIELRAENSSYAPIIIKDEQQLEIFGVVTFSIYRHE